MSRNRAPQTQASGFTRPARFRIGLGDATGIVAALVAVAYVPGLVDPLTYPKLLVLSAGGVALLPSALSRFGAKGASTSRLLVAAPVWAAMALVLWSAVSWLGSQAPWSTSLFGWWGRGVGVLALIGACGLFVAGAALTWAEIDRCLTWVLVGATVACVVGWLQAFGLTIAITTGQASVISLMGNTNFAAGYFAILAPVALWMMLRSRNWGLRVWAGLLLASCLVLALFTRSLQGPVALIAGILVFVVTFGLLAQETRLRQLWRIVAAGVLVVTAALVAWSLTGSGPLAFLWSERTYAIRQEYWDAARSMINGLPIFGTGPDGFARYVSQFRSESYVELLGPVLRVSAAHNIALQFGATLGWVGLALWLLAIVGSAVLLLAVVIRALPGPRLLTSGLAGALAAYLVQGMVSIDMLPLLASGWLIAGLAVGLASPLLSHTSDRTTGESGSSGSGQQTRKGTTASSGTRPGQGATRAVTLVGIALGGLTASAIISQMTFVNGLTAVQDEATAVASVVNSRTPCQPRNDIMQAVLRQSAPEISIPALYAAVAQDPRCPPIINLQSEVATNNGDAALARSSVALGIQYDPLSSVSWLLLAKLEAAEGNVDGAREALGQAKRLLLLYPEPQQDAQTLELIVELETQLEAG